MKQRWRYDVHLEEFDLRAWNWGGYVRHGGVTHDRDIWDYAVVYLGPMTWFLGRARKLTLADEANLGWMGEDE